MSQPRESWEMWHDDYYDQFEYEQDDIEEYKRERDEE